MIIATLPAIYREELCEEIVAHPLIGGVRYNVGVPSPFEPKATLEKALAITKNHGKKFWLDLKGRQLRITHWAAPLYGKIVLNHEIEVTGSARVYFRGNDWSELKLASGNTIYVEPPPREAVGQGQAINIIGEAAAAVRIKGYLTDDDRLFLSAAKELGIADFMLSFAEQQSDIDEARAELGSAGAAARFVLKLESLKGLEFAKEFAGKLSPAGSIRLMAARDDLYINIGSNKSRILSAMEEIKNIDDRAIAASWLFGSLEKSDVPALTDYSDLHLLAILGYKHFLLSDGVCQRCFARVMEAWQDYLDNFPLDCLEGDLDG